MGKFIMKSIFSYNVNNAEMFVAATDKRSYDVTSLSERAKKGDTLYLPKQAATTAVFESHGEVVRYEAFVAVLLRKGVVVDILQMSVNCFTKKQLVFPPEMEEMKSRGICPSKPSKDGLKLIPDLEQELVSPSLTLPLKVVEIKDGFITCLTKDTFVECKGREYKVFPVFDKDRNNLFLEEGEYICTSAKKCMVYENSNGIKLPLELPSFEGLVPECLK